MVRAGIAKMKAAGADVMLMNPQYAPAMLQHKRYRNTLHVLDAVAYAEDVPLFPRFAIMRHWAEDGRMRLNVMLTKDRLHMTDVSYDCLARQVAASIDGLAGQSPSKRARPARPRAEALLAKLAERPAVARHGAAHHHQHEEAAIVAAARAPRRLDKDGRGLVVPCDRDRRGWRRLVRCVGGMTPGRAEPAA